MLNACTGGLCKLIGEIVDLINNGIVPLLSAIAVVVFFWGIVRYIYESGDAKAHGSSVQLIGWGLVALFVLFSLTGILALFKTIFPF